jgi:osmotically-inducible protein OsmY
MFSFPRRKRTPSIAIGVAILGGIGLGAALMYLFDPLSGRRRRSMLRERYEQGSRVLHDATEAAVEAAASRTRAAVSRVTNKVAPADVAEDSVLVERVRAAVGRVIDDAQAIEVRVRDGVVTLKGPARADEIAELVACAGRVRGVREVDNRLSLSGGAFPTGI